MSIESFLAELERKAGGLEPTAEEYEVGTVVEVGDGIARITGIVGCRSMEMIQFSPTDGRPPVLGVALNLEAVTVGAIVLGSAQSVREGDPVRRLGKILSVPVGNAFLGRVVDPFGNPVDGQGAIKADAEYPVEKIAPGVMSREPVNQPVQTGIKAIDALVPIGRGQRELLIGDRQTGKTAIALDTILNQKGKDMICIYVAVGQKKSKVARFISKLEEAGALPYTIVVLAGSSDGAALSYIAPYSGTALAEYFLDQGKDVLVIYDDLSKHAVAYREISLLLRRPPGREAYPGDIFYLHSRLLERACRRNEDSGGGSITALPIIETQAGDVSAYIPTNVISITDGQIFLQTNLFYKGIRPAINVGLSVSRVGGAAQIKSMKKVVGKLKLDMAQYRELEGFAQFSSDLDPESRRILERGARITEILKQPQYRPLRVGIQVALMYAATQGYLDSIDVGSITAWEKSFTEYLLSSEGILLDTIERSWGDDVEADLRRAIESFAKTR